MELLFIKRSNGWHEIHVRGRRKGPDLRRPPRETGPTLPHDLVHAAVEKALGLRDGFWDAVDAGATFDDFEPLMKTRHRRSGLEPLARLGPAVMPAELAVSWAHRAWSGQRTQGRGLGTCPLTPAQLRRAADALDHWHARWVALAEGESLTVRW
jgi:hypothetical protein